MSTLNSTPPPEAHRLQTNGFSGQYYDYDPFIPSSPSLEQLIPVERSPDPQTYHTPSPLPATRPSQFGEQQYTPSPFAQIYTPPHPSVPGSLGVNGVHTPSVAQETHEPNGNVLSLSDFLSPNVAYLSDYTDQSELDATPDGGAFWLNAEDVNIDDLLVDHDAHERLREPTPVETYPSREFHHTHRPSSGTATLASHLMSPVLTDSASPRSGVGVPSPPSGERYAKGADIHVTSSVTEDEESMAPSHVSVPMQHTPALTGSSMGTSPDRSMIPSIARAASPVVRVESYSRGDSPARVTRPMVRSGSKRSRGSGTSYLAVQNDAVDEDEEDAERHESRQTAWPPGVHTDEESANPADGRAGLDPAARLHLSGTEVPNFQDQEENDQIRWKNADVEDWLARSSDPGGAVEDPESRPAPPQPSTKLSKRRSTRSTGENSLSRANLQKLRSDPTIVAASHIPGPGRLIIGESDVEEEDDDDERTEEEETPDVPESPPVRIERNDSSYFGSKFARPEDTPAITTTPPPLYRAKLWQDPVYDAADPGVQMQPVTSNAAIMRYEQRAKDFETLSRAATCGTRRMSESDLEVIFHRLTFKEEKDARKLKGDWRGIFLDKILPRRGNSLLKRKESDGSKAAPSRPTTMEHSKKDSFGSRKESLGVPVPPQRMPSLGKRPKSPKINTVGAVAAIGNQIAAVGASGPASATGASPTNAWTSSKNFIRRSRSRSDLHVPASSTNLVGLWTKQGGPPMPALASPAKVESRLPPPTSRPADPEDEDDDDAVEDKGVTIDFSIRADPITPTLDGFKSNVRQLNPRLPVFMIERVAQEQLRRYKKLVDFKVKHIQAINLGKCSSGKHCIDLGGEPTYLPSKSSSREPEHSHTGFSITGPAPSDEDINALAEGIVTPAQFPPGVPMPPVKRLPAEFECSLCFKVKKFHKPSDWSKHVHEDVQPFTCTFETCAEPKSFKRKADWVRHENERHRQLEWWQCSYNDCNHKCYRKDNFVQHLVREHKLPEPKVKTAKAGKVRGPSSQKTRQKAHSDDPNHADDSSNDEIDHVWRLVEECRHETDKNPKDEECKFCGNICNSWKKLTVHLAKHMEQISMPVLTVVKLKDVTPETIVSPIEQRHQTSMSPTAQSPLSPNGSNLLSYGVAVEPIGEFPPTFPPVPSQTSYFADSADAQPVGHYARNQPSTYPPAGHSTGQGARYAQSRDAPYLPAYHSYGDSQGQQFVSVNRTFPPHTSSPENLYGGMRAPTSQPRSAAYGTEEAYRAAYHPQQQHHQLQQQQQQQQQQQVAYTSPVEAPMYATYRETPPTSYSQQTTIGAPTQLYHGLPDINFTRAQGEPSIYSQQPQQPGYPFHQQ
ncbi:hypothetical protein MMC07_004714 [Pseudocyphellaria aurata]|nr:hypothetical protein [Pseudocyphellaria aurata]